MAYTHQGTQERCTVPSIPSLVPVVGVLLAVLSAMLPTVCTSVTLRLCTFDTFEGVTDRSSGQKVTSAESHI